MKHPCQKYLFIELFDLMVMGLKQQVISCKFPEELLQIVTNHIQDLSQITQLSQESYDVLKDCLSKFHDVYFILEIFKL